MNSSGGPSDVKLIWSGEEEMPEKLNKTQAEIPYSMLEEELDEVYVFEDRSRVAAFIDQTRLGGLLVQAREPLTTIFGEAAVKRLSLIEDNEGCSTLFCLIAVSGALDEARRALRSFDQRWWLDHSHEAAGKLNFDVALI
jgi:hypothetical protein